MNVDNVSVYLDEASKNGLQAHAEKHGLSLSALLRIVGRDAATILACPICGTVRAIKGDGEKPGNRL